MAPRAACKAMVCIFLAAPLLGCMVAVKWREGKDGAKAFLLTSSEAPDRLSTSKRLDPRFHMYGWDPTSGETQSKEHTNLSSTCMLFSE